MVKSDWTGKTLRGRYKIEELLGKGGMSSVYKATDPNLRRTVAIKLIHKHLSSDPQFVSRFEEEAAAVAQLDHPNVIKVYDFDQDGDIYFMVLEFVPGESLQERLIRLNEANRRFSLGELIEIAASICDALDYAHARGTIHRDVKPANIMFNKNGQAILMDFGIAKIIGGKQQTATGLIVGTAVYMSPKQTESKQPDSRIDIYSLGVVLFEMVGGRPPFEGDSAMEIMLKHLNDPVPDLSELNSETPPALKKIIEKALAKELQDRYQSASEMAVALRDVIKESEAAIPPLSEPTSLEEPKQEAPPPIRTVLEPPPSKAISHPTILEEPVEEASSSSRTIREVPIPSSQLEDNIAPPGSVQRTPIAPLQPRPFPVKYLAIGGVIGALVLGLIVIFAGIRNFQNRDQSSALAIAPPTLTSTPTPAPRLSATSTPEPENILTSSDAETPTPVAGQGEGEPLIIFIIAINVREGPGIGFDVIWTFEEDTSSTIIGRFEDTRWILVRINDPDRTRKQCGWVFADLLGIDVSNLPLVKIVPDVYNCPQQPTS